MATQKRSRSQAAAKTGAPRARSTKSGSHPAEPLKVRLTFVLKWLARKGTQRDRENLARFAIAAPRAFGVSMANLRVLAKQLGRDRELAAALWGTGWYEARLLATLIDDPDQVTAAQMEAWCRDVDNWAICDTACFALFDRSPLAWRKIAAWSTRKGEFQKRAAFALLASLALHDKETADAPFAKLLGVVEAGARDERNFVKKGVSWALRAVGRRSVALHAPAVALARRLAAADEAAPRWVGKDALRDLKGPVVTKRLAALSKRGDVRAPTASKPRDYQRK